MNFPGRKSVRTKLPGEPGSSQSDASAHEEVGLLTPLMRRFFLSEIVAAERRTFAPVEESNKSGDLSACSAVSRRRRCITSRSPASGRVYQSVSASSDLVQAELLFAADPAQVDDVAALLPAARWR